MNTLQRRWRAEKCPLINGVLYGKGDYYPAYFEDEGVQSRRQGRIMASERWYPPKQTVDIKSLSWCYYDVYAELSVQEGKVKAGPGTFGGDGFVALEDSNGNLCWIAFFQDSNPFMKLVLEEDIVMATSELNEIWCFPIHAPHLFYILS